MSTKTIKVPIETLTIEAIRSAARQAFKTYLTGKTKSAISRAVKREIDAYLVEHQDQIKSEVVHMISTQFDARKKRKIEYTVHKAMRKFDPPTKGVLKSKHDEDNW